MSREKVEAETSSDPLFGQAPDPHGIETEADVNDYINSSSSSNNNGPEFVTYEESLTIRAEDESRIVSAMSDASKKKTSGSFYSVAIQLLPSGKMGIGVKDLANDILAISMLKRPNGK